MSNGWEKEKTSTEIQPPVYFFLPTSFCPKSFIIYTLVAQEEEKSLFLSYNSLLGSLD